MVTFVDILHDLGGPLAALRHTRKVLSADGTVLLGALAVLELPTGSDPAARLDVLLRLGEARKPSWRGRGRPRRLQTTALETTAGSGPTAEERVCIHDYCTTVIFDASEYGRWMSTARDNVAVARYSAEGGFHPAAVLHAEQAAQCALKALLHAVGRGERARGHGLLSLLDASRREAGLAVSDDLRDALADLARSYQPTRYPDALPEGTPRDHYGATTSPPAIETAQRILDEVERTWDALRRSAEADGPAGEYDAP